MGCQTTKANKQAQAQMIVMGSDQKEKASKQAQGPLLLLRSDQKEKANKQAQAQMIVMGSDQKEKASKQAQDPLLLLRSKSSTTDRIPASPGKFICSIPSVEDNKMQKWISEYCKSNNAAFPARLMEAEGKKKDYSIMCCVAK